MIRVEQAWARLAPAPSPVPGRGLLVLQSGEGNYVEYLDSVEDIHRAWAHRHGADYLRHDGRVEPGVHPAWNRLPLMLDALEAGYRKVVWLDADVVVVDLSADIFAGTPDDVGVLMKRAYVPWDAPGGHWRQDCWNDGVLVVNDSDCAREMLSYVWACRGVDHLPHHVPGMWELNWVNDWAAAHEAECVGYLDPRWNWMPLDMTPYGPEAAYILGFHGMPYAQRWAEFSQALSRVRR